MTLLIILSIIKNVFISGPQAKASEPTEPESQFSELIETNVVYGTKLLPEANSVSNYPERIRIEGTVIDLPVKPAVFTGNDFPFYSDSASFLETGAYPGEPSNLIIYAHNEPELFSDLHRLTTGKEISIDTNKEIHRYIVNSIKTVEPNEVQYLAPTQEEQLTLITCTGENRSHRLIVVAKPVQSFANLLEFNLN